MQTTYYYVNTQYGFSKVAEHPINLHSFARCWYPITLQSWTEHWFNQRHLKLWGDQILDNEVPRRFLKIVKVHSPQKLKIIEENESSH